MKIVVVDTSHKSVFIVSHGSKTKLRRGLCVAINAGKKRFPSLSFLIITMEVDECERYTVLFFPLSFVRPLKVILLHI